MSFNSDYQKLRTKRKKREEEENAASQTDIAPVKTMPSTLNLSPISISTAPKKDDTSQPKKTFTNSYSFEHATKAILGADTAPEKDNIYVFQKAFPDNGVSPKKIDLFKTPEVFKDGYDFGDVTKTILGTVGDISVGAARGFARTAEGVGDLIDYGIAAGADLFGADDFAETLRKEVSKDLTDKLMGETSEIVSKNSVLGKTSQSATEVIGQFATQYATAGLGKAAGLSEKGINLLLNGGMALGSVGSGMSEAYQNDATDGEALLSGVISGGATYISEQLFGGMGKAISATGFNKGLLGIDDALAKKLSGFVNNQVAKNVIEYTTKAGFEGLEEVIESVGQSIGKKITYMSDEELSDILNDENLLEQFIVGAIGSGFAQSADLHNANKAKTDLVTELTQDEQSVIDRETEKRVAEKEKDGNKLSRKEKSDIYNAVTRDLERGRISTDTIGETVGGEDFSSYKSRAEELNSLKDRYTSVKERAQQEYDKLYQMKNGDKSDAQIDKQNQLKEDIESAESKIAEIDKELKTAANEMNNNMANRFRGSKLIESYNEITRKSQEFTADLDGYSGKAKETVQKAVESKMLNNTNTTHDFVDFVAKISADKDIDFDFTNNERLKESVFALGGDKIIDGFYDSKSGSITLNINSAKSLNAVVGHEITHVLEGTEFYNNLAKAVEKYAKSKGEYDKRADEISRLYETEDTDIINSELVADLVGDYIFTDENFVRKLSAEDKNIFQRIFDEIKYLCNAATAGSKEARQLEKVKKAFEDAYRADNGQKNNTDTNGGMKYSVETFADGKKYVKADRQVFSGNDSKKWGRQVTNYINDTIRNGKDVTVYAQDGDALTITRDTAGKAAFRNDVRQKDGTKRPMTDEEYAVKLRAESHIDEISQVSRRGNKTVPDSKNHNFAKDGFNYRSAYFLDNDGKYYRLTLSVGKNGVINTVYNVGKIKEEGKYSLSGSKPVTDKTATMRSSSSIDSISNSTENVNREISESQKKEKQLEIINESNPAPNSYNTWVRNVSDIMTFEQALNDEEYSDYDEFNPDFTRAMAEEALGKGEITVYSSYPIKNGAFITPSRMEAESYSGNGQIYQKTVALDDVAWIDITQGQYAKVNNLNPTEGNDDIRHSLSEKSVFEDEVPNRNGSYNVYGEDIRYDGELDDIGPIKETVTRDKNVSKKSTSDIPEEFAPVREDISNKSEIEGTGQFSKDEMHQIRDKVFKNFKLKGLNDFIHIQKSVLNKLRSDNFFTTENPNGSKSRQVMVKENNMLVEIGTKGIKETFGSDKRYQKLNNELKVLKLAVVEQLPTIIENSTVIEENVENIHKNGKNKTFTYLKGKANVNGKDVDVRIALKKSPEKTKFWMHYVDLDIKSADGEQPLGNYKVNSEHSEPPSAESIIAPIDFKSQGNSLDTDLGPVRTDIKSKTVKSDGNIAPIKDDMFPFLDEEDTEVYKNGIMENGKTKSSDTAPIKETANTNAKKKDGYESPYINQILTDGAKKPKNRRKGWNWFTNHFVDDGTAFETLSLKTGNRELEAKFNKIKTAEGQAQTFIGNGDADAGVLALQEIFAPAEKSGLKHEFFDYLYQLHNIDRMTLTDRSLAYKDKAVYNDDVTADKSTEFVQKYELAYPQFKEWAKEVYKYNDYLLDMCEAKGIVSHEQADYLREMYPHYIPIVRNGFSEEFITQNYGKRIGSNSPIKKAVGGNQAIEPLDAVMAQRTINIFKAVAKNSFGVELMNTLGANVDVEDADAADIIEDGIDSYDNLLQIGSNGKNPTLTVLDNGKKVTFDITEQMYDALKPKSDVLAYTNPIASKFNSFRRGLLTEYNPTFLITNAVKDAQDVLMNSQHAAKTYANFPKAIGELAKKGDYFKEYIKNGGDQITYFEKEDSSFVKEKSRIGKVIGFPLEKISQANEFIERIPRLAEYIASRESGASIDVALLDAARVTTNFSAGGDVTKFLNRNGATFLNASVQGFAQQVRNVREAKYNGLKGWVQLAAKTAIAGLPALLLNGLLWDDDEDYEQLSDYVKDNYYIVAKFGDGQFVRIPKGRTLSVIQNAFTQVYDSLTGNDELDLNRFVELVINNIAPNNPIDNNIISPIVQAANNKTWYGDDLVPTRLQDVPETEQYDESTDTVSKWLGEKLNYSPYKINYLLDQYTGGVGDLLLPMLTPQAENESDSAIGNILAPLADKFTTDSVLKNQNTSDFYDLSDELKINANSSKATDEDTLKYKYISSVQKELSDLYKTKRELQNSNLSNSVKYGQVRDLQKQINALTRTALEDYQKVNIGDNYATVGDRQYRRNSKGEWQKISDEQLENQNEAMSENGITAEEYWKDKNTQSQIESEKQNAIYKAVGGSDAYKIYSKALNKLEADKDSNGRSISGSRKKKVVDYINSLDIDDGEKYILYKKEYKSDNSYNYEIIEYLNGREDISYAEKKSILESLDFDVEENGNVSW